MSKSFILLSLRTALISFLAALALPVFAVEETWTSLFDGKSLAGWKAAETPATFAVADGAIVCQGTRGHLFYVGTDGDADFENFELSAEVMTKPGTNSGIYIHTEWQDTGWPTHGFEIQVNNSQKEHAGYLENKRTGSLYGIRNVYPKVANDDEWFAMNVVVRKPRIQVRVNGVLVVDYIEPIGEIPAGAPKFNRLGHGTFALQGHDPESRAAYRNIWVKRLPPGTSSDVAQPTLNAAAAQRLALSKDNFPLVDLHTRLTGGLTLDSALSLSRSTGVGVGIATDGVQSSVIRNDAAAVALLDTMKGQPIFLGLETDGREWMKQFSKEVRARFDYILGDSMTYTNASGHEVHLGKLEEAEVGTDVQAFMNDLVDQTVKIISTEPIDVWGNATYLPTSIAVQYDQLWTAERMQKVIAAAVKHGVAIEINTRSQIPSEAFIRQAKAAGAKFTIGSNNSSAADYGDWSYALEMQRKVGLTWKDMWMPGHQPTRAQRE